MKHLSILAVLACAAVASANLYMADFEGGLDAGVSVSSTDNTSDPTVMNYNGSDQLMMTLPDPVQGSRQSAEVLFTFPTAIDLTTVNWPVEVSLDLTLPVPSMTNQFGELKRHNMYWDFDDTANDFGDQTINDGGAVKMIALPGRGEINIGGIQDTEEVVTMRWVFNDPASLVNTYYGATQVDTDLAGTLDSMTPNPGLFESFKFDFVKDFWQSEAGYTVYLDNFTVTPEPASLMVLGLGALLLRRR